MAKKKSTNPFSKIIRGVWVVFISMIILVLIGIFSVRVNVFNLFGELPSYKSMENPEAENDLSSVLLSADGVELGKYYRYNRNQVSFEDLSPQLVNTLLSTEDIRFYDHSGIDPRGLLRAFVGKVTFSFSGGGSTITMQLAENIFRTMTENQGTLYKFDLLRPFIIKIKEWIISIQLEKSFTKDEIMAMYFNTIFFGHNSYGINTIVHVYTFGADLSGNTNALAWSFTTTNIDLIDPYITNMSPTNLSINIGTNANVEMNIFDNVSISSQSIIAVSYTTITLPTGIYL